MCRKLTPLLILPHVSVVLFCDSSQYLLSPVCYIQNKDCLMITFLQLFAHLFSLFVNQKWLLPHDPYKYFCLSYVMAFKMVLLCFARIRRWRGPGMSVPKCLVQIKGVFYTMEYALGIFMATILYTYIIISWYLSTINSTKRNLEAFMCFQSISKHFISLIQLTLTKEYISIFLPRADIKHQTVITQWWVLSAPPSVPGVIWKHVSNALNHQHISWLCSMAPKFSYSKFKLDYKTVLLKSKWLQRDHY